MRLKAILSGVASILLAAAPVAAQQAPDAPDQESSLAQAPAPVMPLGGPLPLLADILQRRAQLGLSRAQVESIERLGVDFARAAIRRQADWQIAWLDLDTLLEANAADPAKPLDLSRVEAKMREIEAIGVDLELTRLRTIEAGKAQLSAEQRADLGNLYAGDDPPEVLPVAGPGGRSGGRGGSHGGGGHPGGGAPGHGGGGGHPGGGHPGGSHPGGGHPGGGRPGGGHPGGGHPGGGGYAHGWHGGGHGYSHGYYRPWAYGWGYGAWPWYGWGYPGGVYTLPPSEPSYWYYCPAYGAYYPDVPSCPEPWVLVPAG